MDYIRGFSEAKDLVEQTTNQAIDTLMKSEGTEEDYEIALDRFISLSYILNYYASALEDEYVEDVYEEEKCSKEDYNKDFIDEFTDHLFSEIFKNKEEI